MTGQLQCGGMDQLQGSLSYEMSQVGCGKDDAEMTLFNSWLARQTNNQCRKEVIANKTGWRRLQRALQGRRSLDSRWGMILLYQNHLVKSQRRPTLNAGLLLCRMGVLDGTTDTD